ncbi:MAG TPA: YdeI/OmpD-associated family protein [Vicinamibacteria bacterium]|nr:YdeI/OmpD-associated family protein [Vicinamibacteria bacterium]
MRPRFFRTPADFGTWLEKNHHKSRELLVGFYKKGTKPSITWPESVREALRFGWIDGVRRTVDELRYTIRFTPRRPASIWSAINIRMAKELIEEGRMHPAGMKAFEARKENRSGIYAYENRPRNLPAPYEKKLKKNPAAWKAFQALAPSYRRTAIWWIVSAKKEETKLSRLDQLIANPNIARPPAAPSKTPKRG